MIEPTLNALAEAFGAVEDHLRRLHRETLQLVSELDTDGAEEPCTRGSHRSRSKGLKAIESAERRWRAPVVDDESGWPVIDTFIRGPQGLGWPGADVRDLGKAVAYAGRFAWCGAFAVWCHGTTGLKREIRRKHGSSCYRLHKWARENERLIPISAIEPGDLLLVGPASGRTWGAHVALACSMLLLDKQNPAGPGRVHTIEGNAKGDGPGGVVFEGVVRQERRDKGRPSEYTIRHVVRFAPEDYEEG